MIIGQAVRHYRLIFAAAAIAAMGCAPGGDQVKTPPNLIIISLDTLRRDAVMAYNDGASEYSQTLGRIARDSIVFENAYCPMPHTQASHMSMLTGVYPDIHQLIASRTTVLPDEIPTMAELLSGHGYRCSAVVSSDWLKGDFGFSRGFETYERLTVGLTFAERVNLEAKKFITKASEGDDPYFLFLHYFDPHSDWGKKKHPNTLPYYSPPEYGPSYGTDFTYCDEQNACATLYLVSLMKSKKTISHEELGSIDDLYRRGVHYLDDELGELMTFLKNAGAYEDALIIVLADHGEELFEHGKFLHEQLYNETISVPLFIKLPKNRMAGTRVPGTVSLVDVLATVLNSVDIPIPRSVQGSDLLSKAALDGDNEGRATVIRSRRGDYAAVSGRYKVIRTRTGITSLFDLKQDPHEKQALEMESRGEGKALTDFLEAFSVENARTQEQINREPYSDHGVLTEEEKDRLRQLGYVE